MWRHWVYGSHWLVNLILVTKMPSHTAFSVSPYTCTVVNGLAFVCALAKYTDLSSQIIISSVCDLAVESVILSKAPVFLRYEFPMMYYYLKVCTNLNSV